MTGEGDAVADGLKRYDLDGELPCPKCGHDIWNVLWFALKPSDASPFPGAPSEVLVLTCVHCNYEVARLPLDAPDPEQGEQAE